MAEEKKKESPVAEKPEANQEKADAKIEAKESKAPAASGNIAKVLEMVEKMTALELAELVKAMEDKFGVSAAAPVAIAAGAPAAAPVEEKTIFNVEITESGANKIAVIKAIREIKQDLGLKEAKDLVDTAPQVLMEGAKKEDAEEAKKKLEEAGAKVTLK